MTEAGMAKQREKERASGKELIEYVNELVDGSQLTEADRVSSLETVRRKILEDHDLQTEATANGPDDFGYSPNVRVAGRTGLQDQLREAAG